MVRWQVQMVKSTLCGCCMGKSPSSYLRVHLDVSQLIGTQPQVRCDVGKCGILDFERCSGWNGRTRVEEYQDVLYSHCPLSRLRANSREKQSRTSMRICKFQRVFRSSGVALHKIFAASRGHIYECSELVMTH